MREKVVEEVLAQLTKTVLDAAGRGVADEEIAEAVRRLQKRREDALQARARHANRAK